MNSAGRFLGAALLTAGLWACGNDAHVERDAGSSDASIDAARDAADASRDAARADAAEDAGLPNVSGIVIGLERSNQLSGVEVCGGDVFGTCTTTDDRGTFSLALPMDAEVTLSFEVEGYVRTLAPGRVGTSTWNVTMPSEATVAAWEEAAGIERAPARGMIGAFIDPDEDPGRGLRGSGLDVFPPGVGPYYSAGAILEPARDETGSSGTVGYFDVPAGVALVSPRWPSGCVPNLGWPRTDQLVAVPVEAGSFTYLHFTCPGRVGCLAECASATEIELLCSGGLARTACFEDRRCLGGECRSDVIGGVCLGPHSGCLTPLSCTRSGCQDGVDCAYVGTCVDACAGDVACVAACRESGFVEATLAYDQLTTCVRGAGCEGAACLVPCGAELTACYTR